MGGGITSVPDAWDISSLNLAASAQAITGLMTETQRHSALAIGTPQMAQQWLGSNTSFIPVAQLKQAMNTQTRGTDTPLSIEDRVLRGMTDGSVSKLTQADVLALYNMQESAFGQARPLVMQLPPSILFGGKSYPFTLGNVVSIANDLRTKGVPCASLVLSGDVPDAVRDRLPSDKTVAYAPRGVHTGSEAQQPTATADLVLAWWANTMADPKFPHTTIPPIRLADTTEDGRPLWARFTTEGITVSATAPTNYLQDQMAGMGMAHTLGV